MVTAHLITPTCIIEARPGWDVPTKTRLDPIAGGDGPPAEPERAPGSGPVVNSTSAPPADVDGFIDALSALSSHLKDRELIEQNAKRTWALWMLGALLLLGIQALADLLLVQALPGHFRPQGTVDPLPTAALVVSAAGTAAISALLLGRLLMQPIRFVPDSADRVALRHEDSPMRDRIRIAQWVLFDTVFTRFCLAERAIAARIAVGVWAVAAAGTLAVWMIVGAYGLAQGQARLFAQFDEPFGRYQIVPLAAFLVMSLVTVILTRKGALADLELAQHYGRQVMAFDRDFGGFLPLLEHNRVQALLNVRIGRQKTERGNP